MDGRALLARATEVTATVKTSTEMYDKLTSQLEGLAEELEEKTYAANKIQEQISKLKRNKKAIEQTLRKMKQKLDTVSDSD